VIYSNENILCYGEHGIITSSSDYGNTWNQISLGDKYSIKKLLTNNNFVFGVSDCSILKSDDGGLTWKNKEISDNKNIKDLIIFNDNLYVLSSNKISQYGIDLQFKKDINLGIDSSIQFSEIETDDENVFISSNNSRCFFRYNPTLDSLDKYLISLYEKDSIICVINLQYFGKDLYATLVDYSAKGGRYIAKSSDLGETWVNVYKYEYIIYTNSFKVFDNNIYLMSTLKLKEQCMPFLLQIDSNGNTLSITDTSEYPDRKINHSFTYSEIIKIKNDTLIAVGKNKLIVVSYDNGKSWEIKSYFQVSMDNPHTIIGDGNLPFFVDKDIIYMYDVYGNPVYKTLNSGSTWLPQKYSSLDKGLHNVMNRGFNKNGHGFLYYKDSEGGGIIKKTTDFGETFNFITDTLINLSFSSVQISRGPIGLNLKDEVLLNYVVNNIEIDSLKGNIYTVIYVFDYNGNLTKSTKIDSVSLVNIVEVEDSLLLAFGAVNKGYNTTYGISYFKDIRYIVMSSSDKGRNWDTIEVGNQYYEKTNNQGLANMLYFFNTVYYFSPKLLIYNRSKPNMLFTFDKNKREFDSLNLPFSLSTSKRPFFEYKGQLFALSSLNNLYHTKYLDGQNTVWGSIEIKQLLSNWDNFNQIYPEEEKDMVLATWSDSTQVFLIIGKSFREVATNRLLFRVNFVKLINENLTSVEMTEQIETDKVLLYSFPPYPLPANNTVKSIIYWNSKYDINDSEISVFDLFGTKISSNIITMDKINHYSALLTWDCGGLISGVYFIYINLKGEYITIPVIISK